MGRSAYLEQQAQLKQKILDVGEEMGMQKMWDYIKIALRDPDVMGKDTFGRNRIDRINNKTLELDDYFNPAFSDDVEAERYQEEMDRLPREIWGKDLVPFRERYPILKTIKYNKARKNWV